ncbi:putative threonine/serine exporter [Bifidobacterium dolichotidis]|uniref:Putative threonine/serine exporter n=1 Tax=Bifidobacterium dolichotidis TaxID=2306976 RepID=A0A430FP41_9BIFI|nr:threonine/serine exporter family protein [Bifidobacterium dolichotidis]RSX54574.1 putative threonine/serine exporter [Bifidobacterium dolichotidis]
MNKAHFNGQRGAAAVHKYHTHSVPLDIDDITADWDKPLNEAGIAAKTSVIVRVGMLDLSAGTGSFRVREMMHRIAYPLGMHVSADVSLTDLQATCSDKSSRITEVINLPTTGVNTERIWLLEHFADWFSVNLGSGAMYHSQTKVSDGLMQHLDQPDASQVSAKLSKQLRETGEITGESAEATGTDVESSEAVAGAVETAAGAVEAAVDSAEAAETPNVAQGANAASDVAPVNSYVLDALEEANKQYDEEGTRAKHLHEREGAEARQERLKALQQARANGKAAAAKAKAKGAAGMTSAAASNPTVSSTEVPAKPVKAPITVRQAHERLDMIERRKPLYSPWFSGFAAAVACASFVFLLGGNYLDMIGAFVGAGLGQWLRRKLFAHRLNQFFVTFIVVAVAAIACEATLKGIGIFVPSALHRDTAYIGAMLFVIPGFPLITGGLDMAKIDFPSGVQRIAYVCCIILMATLAGWIVASAVHLSPSGFDRMELNPWLVAALRAVFSFLGVWGFSVLFNSPQRMCLVAATIGMIANTIRLESITYGMSPELAALICATLAGLLATVWRSSVRKGLLAPHLGYPRICLTVPSIVIMVPGLYMYQAMYELGQFNTLPALNWCFRAFMVIICLPIGLAMARVITDRSWRYDE